MNKFQCKQCIHNHNVRCDMYEVVPKEYLLNEKRCPSRQTEIREQTELFAQYTNRGNNVKEVFSLTYVLSSPIHPYVITGGIAHLFINIRDSKGNLMCNSLWLNHNRSIVKLELEPGDRIEGQWWAEQYWYSNNYHQCNIRRGSNKNFYRLLFPQNVVKIGKESIRKQLILNLKDLTIHEDFDEMMGPNVTEEVYWLSFIQLIDNCSKWNLLSTRTNNVINAQYPPEYILISKWKQLTNEEQEKILNCRRYSLKQIQEYYKVIKEQ